MRLVNPGLGEVADRLTILALKVAHARERELDAAHLVNERNALLVQLRSTSLEADGVREALLDLAAVNAMLWNAEDTLREFRRQCANQLPDSSREGDRTRDAVVLAAFRIQSLNDQRATLVRTLNQLAGTDLGPEKL